MLTVIPLGSSLYLEHRIETRLSDRLSCRLGEDLTVSVSAWGATRATLGAPLDAVSVEAHAVPLGKGSLTADVALEMEDVARTEGGLSVGAATAQVRVPLSVLSDHVGLPVTGDGGHLLIGGGARSVVIEPTLGEEGLGFEVVDIEVAGYSLGRDAAERLVDRLGADRFTDRLGLGGLPAGLRPTDVGVVDDELVVDADVNATAMAGAGDSGCAE